MNASEFGPTSGVPEGITYIPEFLTPDEERVLLSELAALDWDGRGKFARYGQVVRRRELDFLHDYRRASRRIEPGLPLPAFLEPLRNQVASATGIAATEIGQVITAMYRPDAGIDWHTDSVKAFGEMICGVSLHAACTMQFRLGKSGQARPYCIELQPRSLLIMQGQARWEYQHCIPPVRGLRYSVTMRTLRTAPVSTQQGAGNE